jgi:hypothetical protein
MEEKRERVKIHKKYFKILNSQEPVGQFQSNSVQIILGQRELKCVQIKGQVVFKGEIITKM